LARVHVMAAEGVPALFSEFCDAAAL